MSHSCPVGGGHIPGGQQLNISALISGTTHQDHERMLVSCLLNQLIEIP